MKKSQIKYSLLALVLCFIFSIFYDVSPSLSRTNFPFPAAGAAKTPNYSCILFRVCVDIGLYFYSYCSCSYSTQFRYFRQLCDDTYQKAHSRSLLQQMSTSLSSREAIYILQHILEQQAKALGQAMQKKKNALYITRQQSQMLCCYIRMNIEQCININLHSCAGTYSLQART